MRRRANAALLQQIAAIRGLQCIAVEARAAQAAAALREKTEIRDESEKRRQDIEDRWISSLTARFVQAEMLPLLSVAFLREDEAVRSANQRVERAAAETESRTADWHRATMYRDTAKDMARQAARDSVRHRDEATAQDVADRYAQRWSGR